MKCWICCDNILESYLLPERDDVFKTPKDPQTYEIKIVEPFTFLYYHLCLKCMNSYIINFPFHKNLQKREIGLKKTFI
jgi:hypothetical protein